MFIKNKKQIKNKSHFSVVIIFLSLMLLSLSLLANGYRRYEFPPLEVNNSLNTTSMSENQYVPNQNKSMESYYHQPQSRYIFPALEQNEQKTLPQTKYNFQNQEMQQWLKKKKVEKYYQNNYKRYLPSSGKYGNSNLNVSPRKISYPSGQMQQMQPSNYNNSFNPRNNYSNGFNNSNGYNYSNGYNNAKAYNNSYYPMTNPIFNSSPFQTNGFMPMNNWSPFSNSLSTWPNFNNGLMNNPGTQNYPNIRTPGFFSQ